MSEWKPLCIDELFKLEIGGTPSRSVSDYWASEIDSNAYSWASISDFGQAKTIFGQAKTIVKTKEKITSLGLEKSNAKLLPPNTLIFSFKLTIGKVAFTGIPMATNEAIAALIPINTKIDSRLIYYLLPSALDSIVCDTAVKGKTLNKAKMANLTFRVPVSLAEQQKIADILSTVDDVIEKTEAAIEKYQAIKAGMMQDLFTRGIDTKTGKLRPTIEEAPELYKESELGWIPKEWEIVQIGDFAKIKGGKRMPAGKEFSEALTPFPYLRVTDMQDGSIDQSDLKYVPVEIEPLIRSYKISVDDVYVTIAGTLGLFGTIPMNLDQAQLTENAARITEFDKMEYDRDFIKHQCNSTIVQGQVVREIGVGGGVPKLALYRIAKFLFLKPSVNEQQTIVEKIRVVENKLSEESRTLNKYKQIKQGLMADLLTGYVKTIVYGGKD